MKAGIYIYSVFKCVDATVSRNWVVTMIFSWKKLSGETKADLYSVFKCVNTIVSRNWCCSQEFFLEEAAMYN